MAVPADDGPSDVDVERSGRSATLVAAAILASKLVGLVRHRVTAHFFGTSIFADVVVAAFRIGNIAQNLLGEGTLSATFIPIYGRLKASGQIDEANRFARVALGGLLALVSALTAAGILAAPLLTRLIAGGFDPHRLALTESLVRWLFPMTGTLVLCAWGLGVLNANRRFFASYAAPVLWSLCQIGTLLIAGGIFGATDMRLAYALAGGAFLGATIELGFLLQRARRFVRPLTPRFSRTNPHLREAARRLPEVLLGRGVILISGLVDTALVTFLGSGALAVFGYAQTLYLLPMSVVGTGEAAVSLTDMSADSAIEEKAARSVNIRRRLTHSFTRILALAIPAMVVLIFFGHELAAVLFQTGRFDAQSTARVGEVVRLYGFALVGNASVRLMATTFFALGETRLPARFAVVRVVTSTALSLLLMQRFGVAGVVAGAMLAGWIQALLLGAKLRRRLHGLGLALVPWWRLLGLVAVTMVPPFALRFALSTAAVGPRLGSLLILGSAALAFVVGALAFDLLGLRRLLRRR
ncbi:MAG: murein biosynthesis integral membrane protein MurJ [Myxococcota bacterium]